MCYISDFRRDVCRTATRDARDGRLTRRRLGERDVFCSRSRGFDCRTILHARCGLQGLTVILARDFGVTRTSVPGPRCSSGDRQPSCGGERLSRRAVPASGVHAVFSLAKMLHDATSRSICAMPSSMPASTVASKKASAFKRATRLGRSRRGGRGLLVVSASAIRGAMDSEPPKLLRRLTVFGTGGSPSPRDALRAPGTRVPPSLPELVVEHWSASTDASVGSLGARVEHGAEEGDEEDEHAVFLGGRGDDVRRGVWRAAYGLGTKRIFST